ncbi:MAG TPA: ABC transporter ATP-binding protein [Candidatus Microsaccharimonas sp.]|jgi:NitT/TauT family transport system ATP-binding protein
MIAFKDVCIDIGTQKKKVVITENLNISFKKDEFTCILGPSGCGKTTLLNVIAGFYDYKSGEVKIDGYKLKDSPYKLSYVFQGHNIFPWKTVRQNIVFGLASLKLTEAESNDRVSAIAKDVGLYEQLEVYPYSLSGGMKQRVGIARALVGDPDIILMDEPLASLDALTAQKTRELLKDLCDKRATTIVYVTHDIDEALDLAGRVLVVSKSPMEIILDQRVNDKHRNDSAIYLKLRNKIYNALKANIGE